MDDRNREYIIRTDRKDFLTDELRNLWHSVGWVNGSARDEANCKRLQEAIRHSSFVVSVTNKAGKLIGLLSAIDDTYNAYITYCIVAAQEQGRGIGTQLMVQFCKRYAGYWWHLKTEKAAGFYEKFSFSSDRVGMSQQPQE